MFVVFFFQLCAPIALFFLNAAKELLPIAIQLHQDIHPDNPVSHTLSCQHYSKIGYDVSVTVNSMSPGRS